MAETTGQLDQLIEQKINNKINKFSQSITDQIKKFLEENGDSLPDQLYVGDTWERSDNYGTKSPTKYVGVRISDFRISLASGIADSVKHKMITKATKELLDKVELLS